MSAVWARAGPLILMFLWFIGTAVVSVWYIFRDPRFDYRFLAVGAVLPDVIDLPNGHARWACSS